MKAKKSTPSYRELIGIWAVPAGRNRQGVVKALAGVEGKSSQVAIGNIREVVKVLIDLQVEAKLQGEGGPLDVLYTISKDKLAKEKALA